MIIDSLSSDIISRICFHGEASAAHLAKEIGSKEHTVRRALKKLLDRKIIYPNIFFNPQARGVHELQIYLKLLRPTRGTREQVTRALMKVPSISYLRSVGGPYEYDILICVRSLQEVSQMFEFLSEEVKGIEYTKVVAAEMSMTYFAPHYSGLAGGQRESLGWNLADTSHRLDEVDQKILASLAKHSWLSKSVCARSAGLPLSTFEYRVKNLFERRIILAFGYMVNSAAAGLTPYTYLIQVNKTSQSLNRKLFSFCAEHPNVSYIVESLGAWDYEIGTRFQSGLDGESFMSCLTEEFGESLGNVLTLPVYGLVRSLSKRAQ
jgi:DNA-binding Lrp family transcriptional regulator